jgi:hypothetical protein
MLHRYLQAFLPLLTQLLHRPNFNYISHPQVQHQRPHRLKGNGRESTQHLVAPTKHLIMAHPHLTTSSAASAPF